MKELWSQCLCFSAITIQLTLPGDHLCQLLTLTLPQNFCSYIWPLLPWNSITTPLTFPSVLRKNIIPKEKNKTVGLQKLQKYYEECFKLCNYASLKGSWYLTRVVDAFFYLFWGFFGCGFLKILFLWTKCTSSYVDCSSGENLPIILCTIMHTSRKVALYRAAP